MPMLLSQNALALRRSWRSSVLTALQVLLAGVALFQCARSVGHHDTWLILFFLVPGIRLVLDPAYRACQADRLRSLWIDLQTPPARRAALPWCATFFLVVVPAAVLFLSNKSSLVSGDSRPVVFTATSLVQHGSWEVSEYAPRTAPLPYWLRPTPEGIYSNYPAGMTLFALPVVAVAQAVGSDLHQARVRDLLEKWTAAWLAALCLGLFFLLGLHVGEPAAAATTTLLLATGSVFFTTLAQGLWQHGGVIFWALLALLVEFRRASRPVPGGILLQGLACGMMLACRLSAVLLVGSFGFWLLFRQPRRALILAVAAAIAYLPWAALYLAIYHNPLGPSLDQTASGNWRTAPLEGILGVLFSPARGLLVYQPWLWAAVIGGLPVFRASPERVRGPLPTGWRAFCLTGIVVQVALVGSWVNWWGGYSWGSRLMAEVIPLAALLCVRPIGRLLVVPAGRRLVTATALLGILLHIPAASFDAIHWNPRHGTPVEPSLSALWSWREPPFLFPFQRH